jgi:hypothetical protein
MLGASHYSQEVLSPKPTPMLYQGATKNSARVPAVFKRPTIYKNQDPKRSTPAMKKPA